MIVSKGLPHLSIDTHLLLHFIVLETKQFKMVLFKPAVVILIMLKMHNIDMMFITFLSKLIKKKILYVRFIPCGFINIVEHKFKCILLLTK